MFHVEYRYLKLPEATCHRWALAVSLGSPEAKLLSGCPFRAAELAALSWTATTMRVSRATLSC